ncbi:MvaI/BcnI family restriction endonuclease [Oceanicoccus sagamiensis]|uniref:MvaI/BcnI restriction endonuclease domain-containing protein n=1 Tax=Oceanicoccus sagamiensis TaxID=716816 RepID=A0A1X9NEM0_9GAMM|nr:MvaI/BcnI family restriction endonuclease [Oceanicoccus sagamiensis]ARN74882.1 hypothetical protein BST96_12615 [Oceanicoccus sagamiensis]
MRGSNWSEKEVSAAVTAYLKLYSAEKNGEKPVKSHIYNDLSKLHPNRTPKSFELKFQNISAVLHNENLPYCNGLKPRFNYQKLLRLVVLDQLDRTPIPSLEPHEILREKLSFLKNKGAIKADKKGTGKHGLALEEALGISANSSKKPDFMGIELKTKKDKSLQTLFSRTPSNYNYAIDKNDLFRKFAYQDPKRGRKALYTSFNNTPDSLGFYLATTDQKISVMHKNRELCSYEAEDIESALLSKHTRTAYIYITAKSSPPSFTINSVKYCQHPSIIRFLRLVREGKIYLDFTLSEKGEKIKDHGFLWRIKGDSINTLYLSNEDLI